MMEQKSIIPGYEKNINFTSNKYYSNTYMMSHFPKYWYYVTIGSRGRGKTFSGKKYAIKYILKRFIDGSNKKFFWWRLTSSAVEKMTENRGSTFIETQLLEKYKVDVEIVTNDIFFHKRGQLDGDGNKIWHHVGKVAAIQRYADFKGNQWEDYDLIIMDELVRAESEKKTFNIPRAFINMVESVCRKRKGIRVLIYANAINEMQEIKELFGFMPFPGKFGVYKLFHKRAIIEYLDDSEEWKKEQKETMAGVLATASEFTNKHVNNIEEIETFFIPRKNVTGRKYFISLKINKGLWVDIHYWGNYYYVDTHQYTSQSNQFANCYALDRTLTSNKALFSPELIKALITLWDNNKFRFSGATVYEWFRQALERYSKI